MIALNPERSWKYDSHVPCAKNLIVLRSSRPQHWPRKRILDQNATCDSTIGYIPHPQCLHLSPSLMCDSEERGDFSGEKHRHSRTDMGCECIVCVNLEHKNHSLFHCFQDVDLGNFTICPWRILTSPRAPVIDTEVPWPRNKDSGARTYTLEPH